ncbi:SepM family pheromone-processing serine protease [Lapidilactobacillus wuchangensis]|uniref:SepM family pheromone-processing serine protease n=1 Tax=Lapidilactobacillus wuchangensis TaxID=2486001 RepID=UPI000F7A5C32|nr:SepM family pheromone-processing serine protease [Lapidilactobacillus wuchangensis]
MKRWQKIASGLLAFLLVAAFFLLPLPIYIEQPGSAEPLREFVTVNHKHDQQKGAYMLVTVGIAQATPFRWLTAHFDSFHELVSREDLMGDQDSAVYDQMQKYYMQSSINNAIAQAYHAAGKDYQIQFKGIYVMDILQHSNLAGKVAIGDTITAIDGHQFTNNQGFMDYLKQKSLGTQVKVSYQHQQQAKTTTAKIIKLLDTNRHGLGITLTDRTSVKTTIPVKIDAGDIGGPSAGMMFSLQIYEQLTGNQLRHGRKIAGTGTIAEDGTVGAIGGIDKKVVAADAAGATIFFAPDDPVTKAIKKVEPNYINNYQTAKQAAAKIKTKMKIVPVKKFSDVIKYLETHPN